MIGREVTLLLIGGAIALVSGLIGALVQFSLSLLADRIKREREDRKHEVISAALSAGTQFELSEVRDKVARRKVLDELLRDAAQLLRPAKWEETLEILEKALKEEQDGPAE